MEDHSQKKFNEEVWKGKSGVISFPESEHASWSVEQSRIIGQVCIEPAIACNCKTIKLQATESYRELNGMLIVTSLKNASGIFNFKFNDRCPICKQSGDDISLMFEFSSTKADP